ncbi:hypothetical protein BDN70DRAFT_870609 [Pholiota conissans]|uniref:Origin recognition complex subunit 6 n=1 Tax=Pholiota conissans TaxID=109636 RepID=A0A9P5ZDK8_9AGAR|nr:hypothetical protein BDN70DRAFT_870609 [Pholiota conissans]
MSGNKHLLDNFAISQETKDLAIHLFNLAKLNTGEGSGWAVRELAAGIPAACVLMAVERLNTGEVTRKSAQGSSCLKPKDFTRVYESTKAAVEQAERATCITYKELYVKYKFEAITEFLVPWITQAENEVLTLGHQDDQTTRCAVFFWVCNAIKPKALPDTHVFAKTHELPFKSFVSLLESLNQRESGMRRNIQTAFKAQSRSPRKDTVPSQPNHTPSGTTHLPADPAEQESPTRRSVRLNSSAAPLQVATPTPSPRKRHQLERSPTKVVQPPPIRLPLGRKAPLRELPSKDTPKKRPVEVSEITDKMDIDEALPQTPKKRRTDSIFPIIILAPPVTPSRPAAFSPGKKKSTIPLISLPEPMRSSPVKNQEILDDASMNSEDESEIEEPAIRRRFRPVYLEHKQWFSRDPRVETMLKKADKKLSRS